MATMGMIYTLLCLDLSGQTEKNKQLYNHHSNLLLSTVRAPTILMANKKIFKIVKNILLQLFLHIVHFN